MIAPAAAPLGADRRSRSVVFAAEGSVFSAGGDFGLMLAGNADLAVRRDIAANGLAAVDGGCFAPDDVRPAAARLAQRIADLPPLAVQGTKQVLNDLLRARADEVMQAGLANEGGDDGIA